MSDPLNTSTRDTSVPLIVKGHKAKWKLTSMQPGVTDNGPTLKFRWDLQEPAPSNKMLPDGTPFIVMPGSFPAIYLETIFMYSKEGGKQAPDHFVDKICDRIDACLGTDKENNPFNKPTRPQAFAAGCSLQPRNGYTVFEGSINPELIGLMTGKEIIAESRISKDSRDNSDRQEFGELYFLGDYKG